MSKAFFILFTAITLQATDAVAQRADLMDSSPVPEEQDEQFWREMGEGLDFNEIVPGNYLLVSKDHTKEVSEERAEIIKQRLAEAVAMDQQGKTYLYTEPGDKFLIVRFNEPLDPFNPETLVNVIQIVFIEPDEAPQGNAFIFAMNADQGADLLKKIVSILE